MLVKSTGKEKPRPPVGKEQAPPEGATAGGGAATGGAPSPEGAAAGGGAATRGAPSPEGAAAHYKVRPLMPRHMIATPLIWLP